MFCILAMLLCSPGAQPVVGGVSRPNVLLIMIDDQNDWVGCLRGHPLATTPNIDALARRGMLFTNAHCQA
ncbi:MAG: sulfatase-like hydrolase/transferase, partial [Gemmataceae bacterium]